MLAFTSKIDTNKDLNIILKAKSFLTARVNTNEVSKIIKELNSIKDPMLKKEADEVIKKLKASYNTYA